MFSFDHQYLSTVNKFAMQEEQAIYRCREGFGKPVPGDLTLILD